MKDLQVRQLETTLAEQFTDLIDMSDPAGRKAPDARKTRLSRSVAALAVHEVTGWDRERAAACVIDGFDDQGIDAIAVDTETPHVWIVQAKWSDTGDATLNQDAVLNLANGLKYLVRGQFDHFNNRLQPMIEDLNSTLSNPRVQITIVPALVGDRKLSANTLQHLDEIREDYNDSQEVLRVQPLLLSDFIAAIRAGLDNPNVELKARMPDFRFHDDPYLAYHGTLTGDQVARWYTEHRHRLFKRNIRYPLGLTKINARLVSSVLKEPELFWYFHNGITVLCDRLEVGPRGDLELHGASVVNGAQTVASLHEAYEQSAEPLTRARIGVRIIPLKDTPSGFDSRVTIATNTQNSVIQQDFRALDKIQERLRYEFDVDLKKTYVIKRGESLTDSDEGCGMHEAAVALACAHTESRMSYRARSDDRRLWDDDTYPQIFRRPNARKVWRAVQMMREVPAALTATQEEREGRAALLAQQGIHLLTHLVLGRHGDWATVSDEIWYQRLGETRQAVDEALRWTMHAIDTEYGTNSQVSAVFRSAQRYEEVASRAAEGLRQGGPVPELAPDYKASEREQRARLAKAVTVIIDAEAIEEGTGLEFRPVTGPERFALAGWIAQDPRRGRATWVRHKTKPLLWESDGCQYAPSTLVMKMFNQAHKTGPKAVQGTRRWFVPGEGSLVDIANRARGEAEEATDDE